MTKNSTRFLILVIVVVCSALDSFAQVSLTGLNSPYSQNFNTLAAAGTTNDVSTLPAGWTFVESLANANTTYAASTGSANAGNTYSLGLDADRALGMLRSGTLASTIGASFVNNTGGVITSLNISYAGEQWRLGATGRTDKIDFQYSTSATVLSPGGTWVDVDALDFSSPISAGTVGLLNGNTGAVTVSSTITGLAIAPGATFWIRWLDVDVTGADDAIGVDEFTLTAQGIPANTPTLSFTPSSLNFGSVDLGATKTLTYTFDASNLDGDTTTLDVLSPFALSLDGTNYNDTIRAIEGNTIYVRFTPTADGLVSDSVHHVNGSFAKSLSVSGTGYDPIQHIIPIVTARGLAVGTKVSVAGRVTASNQLGSPSYLQDGTGGIPVFDFNLSNQIAIGDSIIVTGPIGVFSEQKQISGSGITFIKVNVAPRVITPKSIDISELAVNEGLLVTVQNVEMMNKGFVFYPQSTEKITNGTIQADLRIDGDTDIAGLAKPQGIVNITGVVGRFQANAQLLPRSHEDIPGAVEPSLPSDTIPSSTTFDLMNWNLEFFGAQREDYPDEFGPADEPLQLQNVKQVILSAHPDVVAVQEVSNDVFFNDLVSQLPGYASVCSDRYSHSFDGPDNTFPPQKVCFIYNTETVNVISSRPMFEQLFDAARTTDPTLLPGIPSGDASSFWSSGRLPFILTADVKVNNVTERIHFINIHAKSGATAGDFNRRAYDAQVLKDSLDANFAGEQFAILGDLNDDLDNSIVTGKPSPYQPYVDDTDYFSPTLGLSLIGAKSTVSFNDVIDHQILSSPLTEEYIPGSVRILTPFGSIPNYGSTTSDHLPVLSRYKFIAPVVSLVETSASVTEGDSVQFTVQLSRPADADKTVRLKIGTGTAVVGEDYTTSPDASGDVINVPFVKGATSAVVTIATIDDTTDEPDETASFSLLTSAGIEVGTPAAYNLQILDNDLPSIQFADQQITTDEGSGSVTVRLVLTSPLTAAQNITLGVRNGRGTFYGFILDYTTLPAPRMNGKITLSIPAGATEVNFQFTANKDYFRESDETVTFDILTTGASLLIGSQSALTVTIKDVPPCLPVFIVYPNPTTGPVNIWTLPANEESIVSGALYDPNGQLLVSLDGTVAQLGNAFTEALHGKRRGFYTIRLQQCDQLIVVRLFKL